MRVLVTGAVGFIGRYTVTELARRGHEVIALGRGTAPPPAEFNAPGVTVLRGDLRKVDDSLAERLIAQDAIVHLAATTTGTPRARFEGTVVATERMLAVLEGASWHGRLVHVSSLAVYGFNQVPRRGVINESTPLEPHLDRRDDYAWTKVWQERVIRGWTERTGADLVIVRPGSIYGPERRVQHRLGRLRGRVLLLIGGLTPMPLSYVENLASLLATCVEHPSAAGEVLNAIDPKPPRQWRYLQRLWPSERFVILPIPLPIYRVVTAAYEQIERASGGAVSPPGFLVRYEMTPSFETFSYSTDKPRALLGWTPPVRPSEALRRTFDP